MVKITIDVFSGRPNPTMMLPALAFRDLLLSASPSPALGRVLQPHPHCLGYRGLVVEHNEPGLVRSLPPVSRVYRGVQHTQEAGLFQAPAIERELVRPGGLLDRQGFPDVLRDFISAELAAPARPFLPAAAGLAAAPTPSLAGLVAGAERAPIFEPAWWNDGATKQAGNNCYNYSANYRTDTFAQPGRAAGLEINAVSCAQILPLAVADDLIPVPTNNNEFPGQGHLVAMVIAPGFDFHWYRKGPDGMWSHKIGPQAVTNLDNSGSPIADPRLADRGPYMDFCSFMVVMHGHIKLS
jgi:hypothetical protein